MSLTTTGMLLKYDNLWLDTTMTLADYLPMDYFPELSEMRADRIIFGTDFPNLPYAWDREIKRLVGLNFPEYPGTDSGQECIGILLVK